MLLARACGLRAPSDEAVPQTGGAGTKQAAADHWPWSVLGIQRKGAKAQRRKERLDDRERNQQGGRGGGDLGSSDPWRSGVAGECV